MGRYNQYKNKSKSRNMITKAALNNPHIHNANQNIGNNLRNATQGKTIEPSDSKYVNAEYFEDGIKFTKENGDITYYLY